LTTTKNWNSFYCKFNQKNTKMKFCHWTTTKFWIVFSVNSTQKIQKWNFVTGQQQNLEFFLKTVNSTQNNNKIKFCQLTTTKIGIFKTVNSTPKMQKIGLFFTVNSMKKLQNWIGKITKLSKPSNWKRKYRGNHLVSFQSASQILTLHKHSSKYTMSESCPRFLLGQEIVLHWVPIP